MEKTYFVYILTNTYNTVLYVGVTNNLQRRMYEHVEKRADSFTKKYNLDKLVYFESFPNPADAIRREKQLKGGSRQKKLNLVETINPKWKNLADDLV